MRNARFSTNFRYVLLVCAAWGASACTQIEGAYDSVYKGVVGEEVKEAKPTVQSPAAAPYQEVKTIDNSQDAPVELGSVGDDSLKTPPVTQSASAPAAVENAPAEPAAAAPDAPAGDAAAVALLTIRFNQPHVYYDDALASAVRMAEGAKSGVVYEVLSTVPDLSSLTPEQQEKLGARAKDNLKNVVTKMQQQGVSAERIRIADQTLKIRSQEIQLFVR